MKLHKKLILSIILGFLFVGVLCFRSSSFAAGSLAYSSVNFNNYPGYKTLVDNLKTTYPNWTFTFYDTGLNWTDVINGESQVHGTNLVPASDPRYNGDWVCPICGATPYDTGVWYCASKPAISYMMDPRNSINSNDIFQFQDLSSPAYSPTALNNMIANTFLRYSINDITGAASVNNINPYYLVALMLQEQGTSGSVMTNGQGYLVNGVVKYPNRYNVFNIGATSSVNTGCPDLTANQKDNVILNGLYTAEKNGWISLSASITGGSATIGNNYIKKGQNTLYFQKFNVVSGTGYPFYQHQYQQNILAAQNQGTTMKSTYSNAGIVNSNFNFTIPLYNNMPATASPRPLTATSTYVGNINSELQSISLAQSNGLNYITGKIVIVEWIGGISTVPNVTPVMTLVSTDGTVNLPVFVTPTGTNTYYFDRVIEGLDTSKQYYFTVSSGDARNISPSRTMTVALTDQTLGKYYGYTLYLQSNLIKFGLDTYIGNINSQLLSIKSIKNSSNLNYITGGVVVVEWINGKSTVPSVPPKMRFKSTDNTVNIDVFVTPTGTNTYYFDRCIEGIDTSKQYYFEISSGDPRNVSTSKTMNVVFPNQTLGKYYSYNLFLENNQIKFGADNYIGNINSELKSIKLIRNANNLNYVTGSIVVVEWVSGKSTVPSVPPVMRFKSTDNTVNMDVFVTPTGTNTYYFDRCIEGIDTSKQYIFEISSGDPRNISTSKTMNVIFPNQTLGNYYNYALFLENNLIKFGI